MTGNVVQGMLWFLLKMFVWVIAAHVAVNTAAILNDLDLSDPQVQEARTISGIFISAVYAFAGGRGAGPRG